jgi:hypothetical protein
VVRVRCRARDQRARADREDVLTVERSPDLREFLRVAAVCGRDATKAAFSAPADVPTIRSGTIPRS